MRTIVIALLVVAAVTGLVVLQWDNTATTAHATTVDGTDLSMYMDQLRRNVHKLGLSIDAQNKDLAKFYMGETDELIAVIGKTFPEYDGFQVGALAKAMLTPYMAPLTKALDGGDWKAAGSAYDTLLASGCNGCHVATQHGFVKITRSASNPYNQDFKP